MMAPTHVAVGVALAAPLAVLAPELASTGAVAAIAGSLFPDLDLLVGEHRRSLHAPVYGWLLALPAVAVAVTVPGPTTLAAALFLVAAALHPLVDLLGGTSEPAPWEFATDRGVYLHVTGRWLAPTRWVRYDGAPEDLLVAGVLSVPGLLLFDGTVRAVTVASLGVAVVYTAVRKRVPQLSGRFPGAVLWAVSFLLSRLRR
jgi:hypothetical protein